MAADIIKNPAHTWTMIPPRTAITEEARTGRGGGGASTVHGDSGCTTFLTIWGVLRSRLLPSRRADFGETNAPAHRPWCGRWAGAPTWPFRWPILAVGPFRPPWCGSGEWPIRLSGHTSLFRKIRNYHM